MLIQKIIDQIIDQMTGNVLEKTVDVIKQGDPQQECSGITVTFMGTMEVLQKAVALGHNFIISHEPVFYSHLDDTDWLEDHPVYQAKRDFINENNLVIWRCHDYIHRMKPDGIVVGMNQQLGWSEYADPERPNLYNFPECKVADIIDHLKKTLDLPVVKFVGNPEQKCSKVVMMIGASGGKSHMNVARDLEPDLLICGEAPEWETYIYFQDLNATGRQKSLIVTGHQPSEEAGMVYCTEWLQELFPDLEIIHQPSQLGYEYI